MKYDVVRTIIKASTLQKVFIFLDIFLANNIAPKCFSRIMYVSSESIELGNFPKSHKIKNLPAEPKSP